MTNTPRVERPECVEEEHLLFLDALRESGVCNMWGASASLLEMYPELGRANARVVHGYWMRSFGERHPRTKETPR